MVDDINLDDLNVDMDSDFPEFEELGSADDKEEMEAVNAEEMEQYVLSLPLDKKIEFLLGVLEKQVGRKLTRAEKRERTNYWKRLAKKGQLNKLLKIGK